MALSVIALLTCLYSPAQARNPITRNLGVLEIGQTLTARIEFNIGREVYVGVIEIPADVTSGSGLRLSFDTLGSAADTEIAVYNEFGRNLIAMNDDGNSGPWGDPGRASLLIFGDGTQGNPDGNIGCTRQGCTWTNATTLAAGVYTFMVSTNTTNWDTVNARDTFFGSRDTGPARVRIRLVSL